MDADEIKERVKKEVLGHRYPELLGVEPEVSVGPSETQLRALRRSRAVFTQADVDDLPKEATLVFHVPENAEQPFDRTVVVVTDADGETRYIIESR